MTLFTVLSSQPMHWSIAGIIIGAIVPALLLIGGKSFGVSSSLRHMCAIGLPTKKKYFNYDLKPHLWSLLFVFGIALGGLISHLSNPVGEISVGNKTTEMLDRYQFSAAEGLYPSDLYSLANPIGILLLIIGGVLIGFGTRYANGCTSGHSIFGLATLQFSSLVATICFFIGGMVMTYFILPLILAA